MRIYDTNRGGGQLEARTEIRLKRGDEVSCVVWSGQDGKKRKRAHSSSSLSPAGDLIIGLKSGRIYVIDQAIGEIVKSLEGHTAQVKGWSTFEEKGWSCATDGKIKAWDIRTASCLEYKSLPNSS